MATYGRVVPETLEQLMNKIHEYPHKVSTHLLDPIPFRSILDAGCGTNTQLAVFVHNRKGAVYTGIDNGRVKKNGRITFVAEIMQSELRKAMAFRAQAFIADVRNLPLEIQEVDVSHMRFVLMHLPKADYHAAIAELIDHSRRAVVLIEYDWGTLKGTGSGKGHIELFKNTSLELMAELGVNPYVGAHLEEIVEAVAPGKTTYRSFFQPEQAQLTDLMALCTMQKDLAADRGLRSLSEKFAQLGDLFQFFVTREHPLPFVQPDICTATIWL